jgi:hypothetical protein
MGVLDDAIREHLELKRKHGAAADEVEREEQEALGPPRRQPVQPPAADAPAAGEEQVAATPAAPAEQELDEVPVDEAIPAESAVEPEPAPAVEPAPTEPEPEIEWETPPARAAEPDPAPAEPEPRSGDTPPRGFEQVEDAPLPAEDAGDDAGEEDVLEETPDFLQETPEHDRLWFEQKPPRDFDFDE